MLRSAASRSESSSLPSWLASNRVQASSGTLASRGGGGISCSGRSFRMALACSGVSKVKNSSIRASPAFRRSWCSSAMRSVRSRRAIRSTGDPSINVRTSSRSTPIDSPKTFRSASHVLLSSRQACRCSADKSNVLVKAANCWLLVERTLVVSGCGAWPWAAKNATLNDSEAHKASPKMTFTVRVDIMSQTPPTAHRC